MCGCLRAHLFAYVTPGKMAEKTALDTWRYAHYFEFHSEKDDKNILVKCHLCVGGKILSMSKKFNLEFKKTSGLKTPLVGLGLLIPVAYLSYEKH